MPVIPGVGDVPWDKFNYWQNTGQIPSEYQQQAPAASAPAAAPVPPAAPAPAAPAAPAAAPGTDANLAATQIILDNARQVAYQAYLKDKLRLVDVPMADVEKDKLALARATQVAEETYRNATLDFQRAQLKQQGDQWLQTFKQQTAQFAATLTLQEKELAQRDTQFGRDLAFRNQQLAQQATQFATTSGQAQQGLDAQIRQRDSDLARLELERQDAVRNGDETRRVQLEAQQRQLTFEREQLAQQNAQFGASLDLQQQQLQLASNQYGSQLAADPNMIVASANFNRLAGAARGGGAAVPAAYGATGDQPSGAIPPGTVRAGVPAAYSLADTQIALSPEVNAYRLGRTVPQFGNPTGTAGQVVTMGDLQQGGFNARMLPQAYRNLSPTGRTEVGAINRAVRGQRPEDLEADIAAQLPRQRGSLPSAYTF